jgi:excisionase family DNA binding protein
MGSRSDDAGDADERGRGVTAGARVGALAAVEQARRSLAAFDESLRALQALLGADAPAPAAGAAHAPDPDLLTVPEAAKLLRIAPKTVYSMAFEKRIPGVRHVGRAVRFHRETLVSWIASGDRRAPRPSRKR